MNGTIWVSVWRVCIVLFVGVVSALILQLSLLGVERRLKESGAMGERLKRITTLVHGGRSVGRALILLIVILMILHELGINISPVLASAGVVGLAFSLGTQTVIKDFLGGIIILSENQFTIGDVITVGQLTGTVERISLRATYLRDNEGKLNLIPNGDIRTISNLTTQWAQVVITLNVDYEADMECVLHALDQAAQLVRSDKETASAILDAPRVIGWTGFTDWAVQVQLLVRTKPGMQWMVGRVLRKTALEQLRHENIRVALPKQRVESLAHLDAKKE